MQRFFKNIFIQYGIIFIILFPVKWFVNHNKEKNILSGQEIEFNRWSNYAKYDSCNTIFLGSSKIYCSMNPDLFDSITNLKSYNLGSGSQSIIETFYYLKHAADNRCLKNVVVDLRVASLVGIDYMHLRKNMHYLNNKAQKELYLNSGFAKNFFCEIIPGLEYLRYVPIMNLGFQVKVDTSSRKINQWVKGFQKSEEKHQKSLGVQNEKKIQDLNLEIYKLKNLVYLDSVVDFCQEKKLRLVFTNIPQGISFEETFQETKLFKHYLSKYERILFYHDYSEIEFYHVRKDGWHLNNYGAAVTTSCLAKYFNLLIPNSIQIHSDSK